MQQRHPVVPQPEAVVQQRRALFEMFQPVAVATASSSDLASRTTAAI